MRRVRSAIGLISVLGLGACAVQPPQGPLVMALPPQGKSFEVFQADDATCRGYAYQQTGGASSAQAANNSAVGSALVGTALGAGLGAALGSVGGALGAGAAIGGATGLLAGSAIGAGNAQVAGGSVQARYDTAYTQCIPGAIPSRARRAAMPAAIPPMAPAITRTPMALVTMAMARLSSLAEAGVGAVVAAGGGVATGRPGHIVEPHYPISFLSADAI
jgi:hypothetical protein